MLRIIICAGLLSASLIICAGDEAFAQEDTSRPVAQEIDSLRIKVSELEKAIAELKGDKPDRAAESSDGELEKQIAAELGLAGNQPAVRPPAVPQAAQSTRQGVFQNMNPNISVIGDFQANANTLSGAERNVDLSFDEGEFSFQAAVDPYAKADFFVAFGKEGEPIVLPPGAGSEEADEPVGFNAEIEEAYVTLLSLPFSMQLKAGKFRSKFGKLNETHPHAYNFVDLPLMFSNFFGGEGLNDEGAALSWLLPNNRFFQELTVQVTNGPLENASFARAESNKLLYLAHLKNFFDINENSTLELGLTGLTGPNSVEGSNSQMLGADLTFKWKPVRLNRYKSLEFLTEFLWSKQNGEISTTKSIGFYANLRYQIAKRWFLGGLYDYSEFPEFSEFNHKAYSGILQFFATEFQKVEFQYKYNTGNFFNNFSEFRLRAIFVIGAHGAHQY